MAFIKAAHNQKTNKKKIYANMIMYIYLIHLSHASLKSLYKNMRGGNIH